LRAAEKSATTPFCRAFVSDCAERPCYNSSGATNYTDSATPIAYAPNGAIAQIKLQSGLTETWIYNARFQPTNIQLGALMNLGFVYGSTPSTNSGNVTRQSVSGTGISGTIRAHRVGVGDSPEGADGDRRRNSRIQQIAAKPFIHFNLQGTPRRNRDSIPGTPASVISELTRS
jgi:hypothetical protein